MLLSKFVGVTTRRATATRIVATRTISGTSELAESGKEAPTVFDKIIQLTFVDPSGARRKVPGVVGE